MYNLNFRQRNQLYILKFPISVSVVISASYVRQYVAINDYICDYMWLYVTIAHVTIGFVRVTICDYVWLYVTMCVYVWLWVTMCDYM